MKKHYTLNELRKEFLDFFDSKDHIILPSFPLVPQNDKTLLLINAGMAPIKKYFTGELKFPKPRAASSQKCIRTPDIENVGRTERHAAFFEMLGNFSFGDYFKKEAIEWAMEFLTENMGMDRDKLWATVYEEDDEAYDIWKNDIGFPEDRIQRLGKETNFWELEVGPCGPCSEIFYDRGEKHMEFPEDTSPAAEGERFLEVWNLVFTQFDKQADGTYKDLANPNIDTGMGLERLALAMENANNIFEISAYKPLMEKVEEVTNTKYRSSDEADISIRVLMDHSKAMTFLIGDGVLPSNEGRGYVLRRLMRRALRHGYLLGKTGHFLKDICEVVIDIYKDEYTELEDRKEMIFRVITGEEDQFQRAIEQGTEMLESAISEMKKSAFKVFSGEKAFRLYDTYGFPADLTREILEENGLKLDEEEFNELMEKQRERSRSFALYGDIGGDVKDNEELSALDETEFTGFEKAKGESNITHIYVDGNEVDNVSVGAKALVVVESSPFYGEGGGQVGDCGILSSANAKAKIIDTQKTAKGTILHNIEVTEGTLEENDLVKLEIDEKKRANTMKNHTATHLLHQALRDKLGSHIEQAGSLVDEDRLRFDFTHFEPLTEEEIKEIEDKVNEKIEEAIPVLAEVMSLEEAETKGAIGLFEDKYGDEVRVLDIGGYSIELCGGTHVPNTSNIRMFKILSEGGVSSGVRRIEAITGEAVLNLLNSQKKILENVGEKLRTNPEDIINRIVRLVEENREKTNEIKKILRAESADKTEEILENTKEIDGTKFVAARSDLPMDGLRELADRLRDNLQSGIVVLGGVQEGKAQLVVAVSKDLAGKTYHAGNIVRAVAQKAGGNGGGRPDMAMAGGANLELLNMALDSVYDILKGEK